MRKSILAAAMMSIAIPAATTVATVETADARPHYRNDHGVRYWRGRNGHYYCRRSNGTTGLLVGGVAGAVVGNALLGGAGGTILGAAGGALAGRSIQRHNSHPHCR